MFLTISIGFKYTAHFYHCAFYGFQPLD